VPLPGNREISQIAEFSSVSSKRWRGDLEEEQDRNPHTLERTILI
jgi:hypothetical protein